MFAIPTKVSERKNKIRKLRKNQMKKKTSVFLALTLVFSLFVPTLAASASETDISAAASFSDSPHGQLLFVGYDSVTASTRYPEYDDSDLAAFLSYTDEFVLSSGNTPYNTYGASQTQIVSQADIDNLSLDLVNNAEDFEQIKKDYQYLLKGNMITVTTADGKQMTFAPYVTEIFTHLDPKIYENMELINSIREQKSKLVTPSSNIYRINTHLDPKLYRYGTAYGSGPSTRDAISPKLTLETLADDVVALTNRIVSMNPNAVIWLPFPLIVFPSFSEKYVEPFTLYMKDLKTKLGTDVWNQNIRGFYWTNDALLPYYTPFDETMEANGFGNPMVKAMMSMDTVVTNEGKKLLWMPCYTDSEPENLKRTGMIVNRTTIFDYALLQPDYYFNAAGTFNLWNVLNCMNQNAVCEPGTVAVYGGTKVEGSATVSYTMQLDASVTEQDYNDRYYLYTFFFKDYKKSPFMFYTGDRDSTMNGFVQLLLKYWFEAEVPPVSY